jgi:hypothetical protein
MLTLSDQAVHAMHHVWRRLVTENAADQAYAVISVHVASLQARLEYIVSKKRRR